MSDNKPDKKPNAANSDPKNSKVPVARESQVQRDVKLLTNALGQLEKAKMGPFGTEEQREAMGRFLENPPGAKK
jgi:hypothetical protein